MGKKIAKFTKTSCVTPSMQISTIKDILLMLHE